MKVVFIGLDGTGTRWHPKVARAAEARVNELLRPSDDAQPIELWAEFDERQSRQVVVLDRHEGQERFLVVRFAAKNWASLRQATEAAVPQLAAALVALSQSGEAAQVRTVLESAGLSLPEVKRKKERRAGDPRKHFAVAVSGDLPEAEFTRVSEDLEKRLQVRGLGEVTGSGKGLFGWTVDIATNDHDACVSEVRKVLDGEGLPLKMV